MSPEQILRETGNLKEEILSTVADRKVNLEQFLVRMKGNSQPGDRRAHYFRPKTCVTAGIILCLQHMRHRRPPHIFFVDEKPEHTISDECLAVTMRG